MNASHHEPDEPNEPRWLRLAATLRAQPDAGTLAHVRERLAARSSGPAWVRWLSRPLALAASASLLVVSGFTGSVLLSASNARADDDASLVSTLLGDDGSYGLAIDPGGASGAASADSAGVVP